MKDITLYHVSENPPNLQILDMKETFNDLNMHRLAAELESHMHYHVEFDASVINTLYTLLPELDF